MYRRAKIYKIRHFSTCVRNMPPKICLNNGVKCPQFGLGTWLSAPGEVQKAVKHAIDVGYRFIDCAWLYGNEKEIGTAINEKICDGTVKREELFIGTKLWNTFHEKDQVVPACKDSLKNLNLEYLDLYLIHWPVAQKNLGKVDKNLPFKDAVYTDVDYIETWEGMEQCSKLGLAKCIGVSNFNSKQLEKLLSCSKIKPVMNQVEVNPLLNQKPLIKFCKDRDVFVTAYSPLGSPKRPWAKPGDVIFSLEDPKLVKIAKKHGKTPGQVVLRYIFQLGTVPIPKSVNPKRLEENIDIFDFELCPEDLEVLDCFNCNERAVHAEELKDSKYYPFKGVEF
ncbi:hypothetical protein NQ315_008570 [Exocentrus adspersus]|uniref:NADP-dependent oxidoreductase domain-containing protein n=1 Tax=Exocentrus adspersus TaxID=1586481 RepID=A0AAV8W717_9CUCU|nr:hypothetical protein NQ315_008570 [Exocentrus adspersus]